MKRGFTLIELILYVGMTSLVLLAIVSLVDLTDRTRIKAQTVSEVEQQGALALDIIDRIIRNASTITSPTAGGSAASATVTVATPALSPTVFSLSSGALMIQEGAGSATPLTNNLVTVSGLSFTNLTPTGKPGVLRIQFTLSRTITGGRNEYTYSKNFYATATFNK